MAEKKNMFTLYAEGHSESAERHYAEGLIDFVKDYYDGTDTISEAREMRAEYTDAFPYGIMKITISAEVIEEPK